MFSNIFWQNMVKCLQCKFTQDSRPQVVTLINSKLSTNYWKQIPFPSRDVVITQFTGTQGTCTLINIYNDGKHDRTIEELERFLATNIREVRPSVNDHMIWLGDFNRHHPLWDEERNSHLFTNAAVRSGPSEGRGQRQPNNQHPSDCDNARRGPPKLRWVQWTVLLQRDCLVGCRREWMGTSGLQMCLNVMEGMVEDSSRD